MRAIITGVIVLLTIAVQSTLMQYVQFYGIKPNIIIVVIISIALLRGSREGAAVGAFAGMLYDFIFGRAFGAGTLMGLLLGLSVGTLNRRLYKENLLVVVLITFLFTFCFEFPIALYSLLNDRGESIIILIKDVVLKEALYNCVAAVFVHYIICRANNKLTRIERVHKRQY